MNLYHHNFTAFFLRGTRTALQHVDDMPSIYLMAAFGHLGASIWEESTLKLKHVTLSWRLLFVEVLAQGINQAPEFN